MQQRGSLREPSSSLDEYSEPKRDLQRGEYALWKANGIWRGICPCADSAPCPQPHWAGRTNFCLSSRFWWLQGPVARLRKAPGKMIRTRASVLIERPIEAVFRFVSEDFFENYRKWSPEVIRLEQTSIGPIRTGTTGRQVRRDRGFRSETTFRVTECVPLRTIGFASLTKPYFSVRYLFEPARQATRLTFSFELKPELFMRPLQRGLNAAIDAEGRRVVNNIKSLLEASPPPRERPSPSADGGRV